MALQNRDVEQTSVYKNPKNRGNGVSNFLSAVAVLLSTLALIFSGFAAYQVFTLQQKITTASNTPSEGTMPASGTSSPAPVAPTTPITTASAPAASGSEIQPGQFVQPALRNKGQVELLKVNRIPGQPDVVNVQMRIRALRPQAAVGSDVIYVGGTTARNPLTSETYKSVNGESTGSVSLFSMRLENQPSADAYVWLQVPQGVNNVDIYVPNTEIFKSVPISS